MLNYKVYKIRGLFKKRPNFLNSAPTSTERAAPTERTYRHVLTTNCHLSHFAMSISRRATSAELSTCWSCSSVWWQFDNERAWRTTCVWNFAENLVKILQTHFICLTKHTARTVWAECSAMCYDLKSKLKSCVKLTFASIKEISMIVTFLKG